MNEEILPLNIFIFFISTNVEAQSKVPFVPDDFEVPLTYPF
jgi:hypothetical protein